MTILGSYSQVKKHYSLIDKKTVDRWTLMLPAAGCEYYKKTGGCTMCGFYQSNKKYSFGLRYPALAFEALYRIARIKTGHFRPQELFLYNGGSFFNPREIPVKFARYLFKAVKDHPTLNRVMVESRVEYISPKNIAEALKILDGKKLMIGIGLESQNSYTRNKLIKKGLSLDDFQKTVMMIKDSGAQALAYVFLKPLGLSEEDSLENAWQTIRYCHYLGIDEIEMSCAFIQTGTKMAEAYARKEYSPPTLWTIVEILRRANIEGWTISIGSFGDEPPPIAIPRNDCPDDCSAEIYPLLEDYRQTGKFDFARLPYCSCRNF